MEVKYTNRLTEETSPYLLQHAHNPVDWYPWCEQAFEKARTEDKPIFLSIGYSSCHWCHVMEEESFENEKIAQIMNDNFVNIKVDREQRPDIDEIYMNAVQIMTGSGGWPMSVFLTPDGEVFFAGTYYPPTDSYGRPGFERILLTASKFWKEGRSKVIESAAELTRVLQNINIHQKAEFRKEVFDEAFMHLYANYDKNYGGFGIEPKFPQVTNLFFLLRYWKRTGDDRAFDMVEGTLEAMAKGGIRDHIGGGFARYSTDSKWLVPHFEKMLYDQAMLAKIYAQAYQITKKYIYASVSREIFDYVLEELKDEAGRFYSSEDADSEGREGAFYVWETSEIEKILRADADIVKKYFGVNGRGNFEGNKNVLHLAVEMDQLQNQFGKSRHEIETVITLARLRMKAARARRIRPFKDDKVIVAWNGLMIDALAFGGRVLGEEKYLEAAQKCAKYILTSMNTDGRLSRIYRLGKITGDAFLEDYAYMAAALIELYQTDFNQNWIETALRLSDEMINRFWDKKDGGFFNTAQDTQPLIVRTKSGFDSPLPNPNAVAMEVFIKLGDITHDSKYAAYCREIKEVFGGSLNEQITSMISMLCAFDYFQNPRQQIIFADSSSGQNTNQMLDILHRTYLPNTAVVMKRHGDVLSPYFKYLENYNPVDDKTAVYICHNFTCLKPVTTPHDFEKMLKDF